MVDSAAQGLSQAAHLVLYDGVCGLCNRLVQFLLRHDKRSIFRFAWLQSPIGRSLVERSGGSAAELTSFYVVADYETQAPRVFTRSDAALFVAGELGWPWKMARLLRLVPKRIRDRAYELVTRSRYQLFGKFDHCVVPPPELRNRFID